MDLFLKYVCEYKMHICVGASTDDSVFYLFGKKGVLLSEWSLKKNLKNF